MPEIAPNGNLLGVIHTFLTSETTNLQINTEENEIKIPEFTLNRLKIN